MIDENKVLGTLCRRVHEYQDAGMSLRYKNGLGCVECSVVNYNNNVTHMKKWHHEYYINGRAALGILPMSDNKQCSAYLGIAVAEKILSEIFNDVITMPMHNPGFDFICNKGKKIDVKSSCVNNKGCWYFTINKNVTAEYFLCIAFDNRTDLTPIHLWLIPGIDVNQKFGFDVSINTLYKWEKYELDINKVVNYCDNKKGGDV